jgi:nucleotide-binding universal stress UspA family protein
MREIDSFDPTPGRFCRNSALAKVTGITAGARGIIQNEDGEKQSKTLPKGKAPVNCTCTAIHTSLQNILFATDFFSCSEAALPYAVGLARRFGSTLHTVTVVPEEFQEVLPADPLCLWHSAQNKITSLAKSELFANLKHQELIEEGDAVQVLPELIERLGINLVVLGTHGRGRVGKLFLGSVAEEVVFRARCPVLTVGPHVQRSSAPELSLRNILYATDQTPRATNALRFAFSLAAHEHTRLTLLCVVRKPGKDTLPDLEAEAEAAMERVADLLPTEADSVVKPQSVVKIGAAAEHILKAAAEGNAELVVMEPHCRPKAHLDALSPCTTPYQVLCHATCPVLTVVD